MTREELIAASIKQEAKGDIAGAILRAALDGSSLQRAIEQASPDRRTGETAWNDMHAVAHMWAARVEYPTMPDAVTMLTGGPRGDVDVKSYLRRCEELLDQMQSRPDLAHPDPWGCSDEMRSHLGLPPRADR